MYGLELSVVNDALRQATPAAPAASAPAASPEPSST
jgi:hypothetical protein